MVHEDVGDDIGVIEYDHEKMLNYFLLVLKHLALRQQIAMSLPFLCHNVYRLAHMNGHICRCS